jgi:hypothetical protein
MTPQLGTVFPGTPARFFACQTGLAGIVVWKEAMWQPIFIIVQFVIVLWHDLHCVKIPQGEQINPGITGLIYMPKVEYYPLQTIPSLSGVRIKYISPSQLCCLFLLQQFLGIDSWAP